MIKVLTLAGSEVMDNFICSLITLIASTSELQNYSVNKTYFSMKENIEQAGLQQLGVWLIGEFGELLVSGQTMEMDDTPINVSEEEAVETIKKVMEHYQDKGDKGNTIIQYSLIALSKLTVRFESMKSTIEELIESQTNNPNIEIQQRACEFMKLIDSSWDQHRLGIFEPMPFTGDENMLVDATERAVNEEGEGGDDDLSHITKEAKSSLEASKQNEVEEDPLGDIFGINDDVAESPSDNFDPLGDIFGPSSSTAPEGNNDADPLGDIFGGSSAAPTGDIADIFGGQQTQPVGAPFGEEAKVASYIAYEDNNIKVAFNFERDPADSATHKITGVYTNKSSSKLDGINMQISVKKYLTLQLFAVSSPFLEPNTGKSVTQEIKIKNTQEGQSPIVLRARITYTHVDSGNKVVETKVLEGLPTNY